MSSIVRPALASALRAAGIGPVSMIVGSAPDSAAATMRARGLRPRRFAVASLPISTAAAPSTMPEELPAVCTWWMRSTCGIALQRHRVEAHRAHLLERRLERRESFQRGVRLDELVLAEDGRRRCRPAPRPPSWRSALRRAPRRRAAASAARSASICSRAKPSSVAIRSAPMPCGTNASVQVGVRVERPGAAVGAHRHARHRLDAAGDDQVLPARAHLLRRDVHRLEARGAEAVELHARARQSQPAASAAVLAMQAPCSPIGVTQPITTSSTCAVSRSWRRCSAFSSR